ncbi:MAG: hypothetical protein M3Q36_01090 [bacterium]|nr:hypothetical protein [bacterium]
MTKKFTEDTKVFDVAKPGKGKIVTTSRPVIAPMVAQSISQSAKAEGKPSETMTPSAARKVIQPITVTDNSSDSVSISTDVLNQESTSTDELTEQMEAAINKSTADSDSAKSDIAPSTAIALGPPAAAIATKADVTPAPKKSEPEVDDSVISDAATVDALAKEAEEKYKDKSEQKDLNQNKRDEGTQELIESKKYFVPISHESAAGKSGKGILIVALVLVLILSGVYGAIKAGLIDYDLPWENNESQTSVQQPVAITNEPKANTEPVVNEPAAVARVITDRKIKDPVVDGLSQYTDPKGFKFSYPTSWTRYEGKDKGRTWIATSDYKEADVGQLLILAGASIGFDYIDETYGVKVSSIKTIDDLLELRKSEEVPQYYDVDSVEVVTISGTKVIRYDSGHTTDGVTYEWLNDGKLLQLFYSSKSADAGYGSYKKEASYPDFLKLVDSVSF